jgi:hypothetical protein
MIHQPHVLSERLFIEPMAKQRVNLDALIRREDLEIRADEGTDQSRAGGDLAFGNLKEGDNTFEILRKPDFQRDTCDWSPEAVVELVKNQLDDELIPAVILWKSPNNEIFTIDGAHRLSALIAWVNDDYGTGAASRRFFGDKIPAAQQKAAEYTKQLIDTEVGSFKLLEGFIRNKRGATALQIRRANAIGSSKIRTQWVLGGADKAQDSFLRINRGGVAIDDTEKEIILARDQPECIATRALLRAGTGHQYWWKFSKRAKTQVVDLASRIHDLLFLPQFEDSTKAYELLPMAGNSYSREKLTTLYDLIFVANQIPGGGPKAQNIKAVQDKTIIYLKTILELAQLALSNEPGSLGLHPAVYCYTATGKFQPAAFFAELALIQQLKNARNGLHDFTKHRAQFEDFLVEHKYLLNQLIHKLGSRTRGLPRVSKLYSMVLQGVGDGFTSAKIKRKIFADGDFVHLKDLSSKHGSGSGGFSSSAKAAVRLREILNQAGRCPECGARIHPFGSTIDHDERASDGGASDSDNGQSMHPFCNSGVKERRIAEAKKKPR